MSNYSLGHPIPILIVDDDERNLVALESILDAPDYLLIKASNGEEALWAVQDQDFAVIILDVQMPEMNGFEVARLIKGRKRTSHVPILFLSAHYQAEHDALMGYGAGAVDYLTKPFNPHILSSKVAVFAELYRKTRALEMEIVERRQAEEQVQELNRQLEANVRELKAANAELETFTFATSHDLRGPLGRINAFSAILTQRYRDALDGEGQVFLDFIQQNVSRLVRLVEDLLAHSRVAQQPLDLQPVQVDTLVHNVLQEMARDVHEVGANIQVTLPSEPALGDPNALAQALTNLLQNALKYSAPRSSPVIEIGGKKVNGHIQLWVRDNGIGFDMAYHDKIFEIFRRLHAYNEFEGSGIGLALVKRAMERMGGRVWAESLPDQGATFFLELQQA